MSEREMSRREKLRFNENDIKIAVSMIEQMGTTLDVMYYLLDHHSENAFVIVLISAEDVNVHELLHKGKRDTDLLFCLDEENGLHALICQETKVDGAYAFAERVTKNLIAEKGRAVYCTELEVKTTKYPVKDIIFKVLESYLRAKDEEKDGEIVFKTIH